MSYPDGFLDKDTDELESYLFAHARREQAPDAARARALLSVATAAVGVSVLTGVAGIGARPALGKITTWLAAKWLLVGLGSGLVTIAAAQSVVRLTAPSGTEPQEKHAIAPAKGQPKAIRRARSAPVEPTPSAAPVDSGSKGIAAITSVERFANEPAPSRAAGTAPSASTAPRVSASELTRELTLLDPARAAVDARAGARALQALDEYAAAFPNGSLRAEAAALRVQAVGFADRAQALRLARAFLSNYPTSPLCARVRALEGSYRVDGSKP